MFSQEVRIQTARERILNLPWVVAGTTLAVASRPLSPLAQETPRSMLPSFSRALTSPLERPRGPAVAEPEPLRVNCPDNVFIDRRTIETLLAERNGGRVPRQPFQGLEIDALIVTGAGQVVARVQKPSENLDVVALVGFVEGSPIDPCASPATKLSSVFGSREENVLRGKVRWKSKDLENPRNAGRVGIARAEALAEAYVDSCSLGRLGQALEEVSPGFVEVDHPGRRVEAVAEEVMRKLYAGMRWAQPRIVGYSVLETDGNVWIADIQATSVWPPVPLPQDPPCLFFVDHRKRNNDVFPMIVGYDQGMISGTELISQRSLMDVFPRRRLQAAARQLNPDRKGSAAQLMLAGGVPTDIARGIVKILPQPVRQAAEDILPKKIANSFGTWATLEFIGYNG